MIQHDTVNTNFTSISSIKTHQFITDKVWQKEWNKKINCKSIKSSNDYFRWFLKLVFKFPCIFLSTERYPIFLWISVISEYKPDIKFAKNMSP